MDKLDTRHDLDSQHDDEDDMAAWLTYESEMEYDLLDYYDVCPNRYCVGGPMFKGQTQCDACESLEQELAMYDQEFYGTKAEKREQKRENRRYGPVRHLDPALRPKDFWKVKRG